MRLRRVMTFKSQLVPTRVKVLGCLGHVWTYRSLDCEDFLKQAIKQG